jgi:dihydrofolate synthase/folylpolyglutamate synthase
MSADDGVRTDWSGHPIRRLPKFGAGPGLHRVSALLAALDLDGWLARTPRIAITGTNGKGSTARFGSEILRRAGRRTGLFTSPHLYDFTERFEVDGEPVPDAALRAAAGRVLTAVAGHETAHPDDTVGAFEAFFLLAVAVFADLGVDALVLEAGIGGRFDPVRVARAPLAAVVSVDLDHQQLLGDTLLDIALNKVEIAAPGGVVVLGETLAPYLPQLRTHVRLLGAEAIPLDAVAPIAAPPSPGTTKCMITEQGIPRDHAILRAGRITVDGQEIDGVRIGLPGAHQWTNFRIAAVLARRLLGPAVTPAEFASAVREAAARTTWPGRLEQVHTDPDVTIDVGHSPAAIGAALAAYATTADPGRSLLVLGCSANKDVAGMVGLLAPSFPRILCTRAHHLGEAAARIAELAAVANPSARIETVERIEDAPSRALALCRAEHLSAYVAGGLFLAVEFTTALRGGTPSTLDFF